MKKLSVKLSLIILAVMFALSDAQSVFLLASDMKDAPAQAQQYLREEKNRMEGALRNLNYYGQPLPEKGSGLRRAYQQALIHVGGDSNTPGSYQAALAIGSWHDGEGWMADYHTHLWMSGWDNSDLSRGETRIVLDDLPATTFWDLFQSTRSRAREGAPTPVKAYGTQDDCYFYPDRLIVDGREYIIHADGTGTDTAEAEDSLVNGTFGCLEQVELMQGFVQRFNAGDYDLSAYAQGLDGGLGGWRFIAQARPSGNPDALPPASQMQGPFAIAVMFNPLLMAWYQNRENILYLFLFSVIFGAAFSWIVTRMVTRPVERLAAGAADLAAMRFDAFQPDARRRDEIGRLSRSLKEMSGALAGQWARERAFVAAASHDLKTPLALIGGYAEALSQDIAPEKSAAYLAGVERETARMNDLIRAQLDYLQADCPDAPVARDAVALDRLVDELLSARAPLLHGRTVQKSLTPVTVHGDAALLSRAIGNILDNAARHTPERGLISVRLQGDPAAFTLAVENEGEPIPAADLSRIFDLFYRADRARARDGGGSGVGLAAAARIFARHGLRCTAANTAHGVCFTVSPDASRGGAP